MNIARELCKGQLEGLNQSGLTQVARDERLQRAQVYALLDIADAIREQKTAPEGDGMHFDAKALEDIKAVTEFLATAETTMKGSVMRGLR